MKFLGLIFLISVLWWSLTIAQGSDTTKNQKPQQEQIQSADQKQTQEQHQEVSSLQKKHQAGFIDANGNGIDDRLEEQKGTGKRKGQQQAKDRFIDTDGDGICDGKESAIGLKNIYRKRRGSPGTR